MTNIAVFCGSGEGYNEVYREQAYQLGGMLADRGIRIIYGGARIGLMGAVAEGALANNGQVTGVIPYFLQSKEVAHEGLTEMIVVDTMHERKLKMYERCDAVIVLPGGWGTMDELYEMLTWGQLGLHKKPIGLLNINGFYEPLKVMNDMMVQEGFLNEFTRGILMFEYTLEDLLERMANYEPPALPRLINKQTT